MIFGKKEKPLFERMTDMLTEVESLPAEEQKKFWEQLEKANSNGRKVTTGEQVEKAKEDIAEKGKDSQTEKDRIDESVGEQEKQDGNEDSQSAKDRVDEYEGEEKALKEEDKEDGEKHDEAAEEDRFAKLESDVAEMRKVVDMLVEKLSGQFGWNDEDAEKAEKAKKVYGLGEGVVADKGGDAKKGITAKDINAVLGKIM